VDTAEAPVALATLCSPLVDSYNIPSSNHCTDPVGEEMYACDYPDIAVPGQLDDLADLDDRVLTLSSYPVARPCPPNAVPDVAPDEAEGIPMRDGIWFWFGHSNLPTPSIFRWDTRLSSPKPIFNMLGCDWTVG
jgi:hypothetical protein